MLYIGVDLGTSAVKLLLMDEKGKILKIVSREYPLYFPQPGWSEQKPEDWFEQSMDGIRELTAECVIIHTKRGYYFQFYTTSIYFLY